MRRKFLGWGLGCLASAGLGWGQPRLRLKKIELIAVRATVRTVWLFVRLESLEGLSGLGEASDAFGLVAPSKADAQGLEAELGNLFGLLAGGGLERRSKFLREGRRRVLAGKDDKERLIRATAFSAIEQALWDLDGHLQNKSVGALLAGGKADVARKIPLYANINRVVRERTPQGFARAAAKAAEEGYRFVKLAPFDGLGQNGQSKEAWVDNGVASISAVRKELGPERKIMVDCHSLFTVESALHLAERLRPLDLHWFEEPVAPEQVSDTLRIRQGCGMKMAGGEILFGVRGFAELLRRKAVDFIMPDVKHCGGLAEFRSISREAKRFGVEVSPHNPSGPLSTVASAHACAGIPNFSMLEVQWGEVDWRADLLVPSERIVQGDYYAPPGPGFGVKLNEGLVAKHRF